MIKCPVCNMDMLEGTIYCLDCGARLHSSVKIAPTLEHPYEQPKRQSSPLNSQSSILPAQEIYLVVLETGQVFTLPCEDEYIVGRTSDDQPIFPEIDLTPFDGFKGGVSRLHATIKAKESNITITDLGSTNGTRVNNVRLEPNDPHQVKHGDIITFGKIKTRMLFYK
jgi:pSer/pThr/pTyr-binding forkhead associated (FHA) protein